MMKAATIQVCATVVLTVIVLMMLDAGINLVCSLSFKERTSAAIASHASLVLLIGFFPLLNALNSHFGFGKIDRFWQSLNPITAPWLLIESPHTNSELPYVYLSLLFSFVLAILFFTAAAFLLSRIWQDQVSGTYQIPFTKLFDRLRARRKQLNRDSLDSNTYHWLIHRDFRPALITWGTIFVVATLWFCGLFYWRTSWLIPMNYWVTLFLLGIFVRWMTLYIGARQIGIDRSTGALELLLTSPLSVGDMLTAQQSAIRNYTRPLYTFLAFLHLLFFILGLLLYPIPPGAMTNYILISALVALFGPWFHFEAYWTTFWISLNTGRPIFAFTRDYFSGANRFTFFWMIFLAFRIDNLPNAPTGSLAETIVVGSVIVAFLLWLIFYCFCWTTDWNKSQKLKNLTIEHFRSIAAHPIPDINNPDVKGWDHTKPLFDNPNEIDEDELPADLRDQLSRDRILSR